MDILDRTDHEDRVELDRLIEEKTGKYCDEGVDDLSNEEFMELLRRAWEAKKKRKREPIPAVV